MDITRMKGRFLLLVGESGGLYDTPNSFCLQSIFQIYRETTQLDKSAI